jgi:hypothetical protein
MLFSMFITRLTKTARRSGSKLASVFAPSASSGLRMFHLLHAYWSSRDRFNYAPKNAAAASIPLDCVGGQPLEVISAFICSHFVDGAYLTTGKVSTKN